MTVAAPFPITLLAGPTAGGKSALALARAQQSGAEIVNADSMQLYGDLRVLTARPTPEDETRAPHHLYGVADAAERWSVGRWLVAAKACLAEIAARGRPAIVVGGTGLYFRALTQGLADIPAIDAATRQSVRAIYDELGETAFRARLGATDPQAAGRIASGDRQRLTRALEVFEATGRSLTDWQGASPVVLPPQTWRAVVLSPPRAILYARIDTRLRLMTSDGVLDEVERLVARKLDPSLPAMKALGVASFAAQLAGALTADEALAQAQMLTRRYAKRQTTWFAHQTPEWPRLDPEGDEWHAWRC